MAVASAVAARTPWKNHSAARWGQCWVRHWPGSDSITSYLALDCIMGCFFTSPQSQAPRLSPDSVFLGNEVSCSSGNKRAELIKSKDLWC